MSLIYVNNAVTRGRDRCDRLAAEPNAGLTGLLMQVNAPAPATPEIDRDIGGSDASSGRKGGRHQFG
jgi:hypothetical protein